MKKLGFGCMRFPLLDANDQKSVDKEQVCKMVDIFLEKGFTYFDTAYMYHDFESENIVRECLVQRHKRDEYTLTTKLPTMFLKEEGDQERIFAEQLAKCGVDYFDYYMIHNLGVSHYEVAKKFDSFGFVRKLKQEGKVRQIGFSYHDKADLLDTILTENPGMDFVQLQINYIDWNNEGIQSGKCYEVAKKHGVKIIVMEPVKGGGLAKLPEEAEKMYKDYNPSSSIASWAVRFGASLDNVIMVLSGMSNIEQLEDNTNYMADFKPLNDDEKAIISKAVEIIKQTNDIPCTACEYCTKVCPQNIAIAKYFHLQNDKKKYFKPTASNPQWSIQDAYYSNLSKSFGKASDCTKCKACENECPQHIKIAEELEKVVTTFEF